MFPNKKNRFRPKLAWGKEFQGHYVGEKVNFTVYLGPRGQPQAFNAPWTAGHFGKDFSSCGTHVEPHIGSMSLTLAHKLHRPETGEKKHWVILGQFRSHSEFRIFI